MAPPFLAHPILSSLSLDYPGSVRWRHCLSHTSPRLDYRGSCCCCKFRVSKFSPNMPIARTLPAINHYKTENDLLLDKKNDEDKLNKVMYNYNHI